MASTTTTTAAALDRYTAATPGSRRRYEEALRLLPDGVSRSAAYFTPYPTFIERGSGAYLTDVDGRSILDFGNGNRSLLLGHNHPAVIDAVRQQLDRGLAFSLMSDPELELAASLQERVPSMELMRFTASGTEATMFAVRVARAKTSRMIFARMGGSYHGTHDMLQVGGPNTPMFPQPGTEGEQSVGWGIPPHLREDVVYLPFNDLDGTAQVFDEHRREIATVIVEPTIGGGGYLPIDADYLAGLQDLCRRDGTVLVLDEMISMGIGRGGAQGLYGVRPDLTTTGKVIGGGMPMGCFGGDAELMRLVEWVKDDRVISGTASSNSRTRVSHMGSFNAHPLAMAAGAAQLAALTDDVYARLAELGDYVRNELRALTQRKGVTLQVTGISHLIGLTFINRPIRTIADTAGADRSFARRMELSLMSQGFNFPEGRLGCVNAAMTTADLDSFVSAVDLAIDEAVI